MGLFGPSKKERELEEWKSSTLAQLEATIASQRATIESLGALDHRERLALIERTRLELESLEQEASNRKLAIERNLQSLQQETSAQFQSFKAQYDQSHAALIRAYNEKQAEVQGLSSKVIALQDTIEIQDLGFFEYDNPAKSSVQLASELERVRSRIKAMLKDNSAATVDDNFTFNNSEAQGKRFANDMRKLLLRAYNAEAENAIKSVRAGNIQVSAKRLERTREVTQNLGKFIGLAISTEFHTLRLQEIELAHEHLQVLQLEKELERERKAALREEAKVEAEIRKARAAKEAELKRIREELEAKKREAEQRKRELLMKERDHYENVAESTEVQADEKMLEAIKEKLEDAERAIKDLDYREANVRAGYVYVLSNIGAFGEDVVKIGMTRRLDPNERVKELSGASVPFVFDTHLMVFSQNARGLEHELHKRFSAQRVNKVNPRKEYFHVRPEEVLKVLEELDVTVVEFTQEAEASDYRAGLDGRKAESEQPQV